MVSLSRSFGNRLLRRFPLFFVQAEGPHAELPVLAGRHSHDLRERLAELVRVVIPDQAGDIGDAAVLKDGTEVLLDFVGADAVNDAGVGTFINIDGWKLFGNATAAYPEDGKMKAKFWCIRRFFTWRANKFITDYMPKIDLTGNTKLLEMICDEENMKCNALVSMGVCAAASIEFLAGDNTTESLAGGTFNFRQSYAPFTPAQRITNILTLDVESVRAALTAGGE